MSTASEDSGNRFIAPLVGPDDELRFTDPGIAIDDVYEAGDISPGLDQLLGRGTVCGWGTRGVELRIDKLSDEV